MEGKRSIQLRTSLPTMIPEIVIRPPPCQRTPLCSPCGFMLPLVSLNASLVSFRAVIHRYPFVLCCACSSAQDHDCLVEGPLDNMQTSLMSFPPPVKGRMDHRKLYFTALAQGTHAASSSQVRGSAIVEAIVRAFRHVLLHAINTACYCMLLLCCCCATACCCFVMLRATACYSMLLHATACHCMLLHATPYYCML